MKKDWKKLSRRELDRMIAIGRAAATLFEKKGYLETSIDNIAAASGFSKGGIFHYFSSKNEILYFVLDNYMNTALAGLEERLKEKEEHFSKIKFIIFHHVELYCLYTSEAKTLLHEANHLIPRHYNFIAAKERKYYKIVESVVSNLFCNGLRKGQLKAITFSLFGMCNWIYSWYNPKGTVSPQELSEIIFGIFSKGIWNDNISNGRKSKNAKKMNITSYDRNAPDPTNRKTLSVKAMR